jgi:hypothetical protein
MIQVNESHSFSSSPAEEEEPVWDLILSLSRSSYQ